MPIAAPLLSVDITSAAASQGMSGQMLPQLSDTVANAFAMFIVTPAVITATLTGVAGPGLVSSAGPPVGMEPTSMSSALAASFGQVAMAGVYIPSLSLALSMAICKNMQMLLTTGPSPAVSSGSGIGKLVGLAQPSFYGLLMQQASLRGWSGTELPRFMQGLSLGICNYLNAVVTVPVVSVGPPVPPPPTGPLPMSGPASLSFI